MKHPRVKRNDALTDPRFWAMHYYLLIGNEEIETDEVIEPFFGVTNEAVNEYFLREFDEGEREEEWQYLEIPVNSGFTVQVEYAGSASETRFYINHAEWPQPICLGYDSGHFALPAFRWCEVAAIARACTGINNALALLLLYPSVWVQADDDLSQIKALLVEAWGQLAVARRDRISELVTQTIENRTAEIRWWEDSQLGWINDGRYSFRNPKALMCTFDADRFAKTAAFFAVVESCEGVGRY